MLKSLIESIVAEEFHLILEKDELGSPDLDIAPDTTGDAGGGGDLGGGLEDLAGDVTEPTTDTMGDGGDTAGSGGGMGDLAPGEDSDLTMGDENEDPSMGDSAEGLGGSGGFAGITGGSGGGSGNSPFGDSEESDGDGPSPNETPVLDLPADPIQATLDIALELRKRTGDAQQILNAVKASIQENFENFDDAGAIIQLLWETEEPILQVVARKLILFIKGS